MTRRADTPKRQINLPLQGDTVLVLQLLAAREQCSVPGLLMPVIEQFLDRELKEDPLLERALQALLASREKGASPRIETVRRLRPRRGSG